MNFERPDRVRPPRPAPEPHDPLASPTPPAAPPKPESKHSGFRDVVVAIGGIALLILGVIWLGQLAAVAIVSALPYSVDESIGEMAAKEQEATHRVCDNPTLTAAVQGIVSNLAAELEPEYRAVQVQVIQGSDINAFALPGGRLFVLTGLLDAIRTPEELIGVLGHEMGHAVKRHGMKRIAKAIWWRILLSQVLGDVLSMTDVFSGAAIELLSLSFDRDQERESDDFGLDLMIAAGYAPGSFPDFFERLPAHDIPAWFTTHPDPEERATSLRAKIAALPSPARVIAPPSLEALQSPCLIGR